MARKKGYYLIVMYMTGFFLGILYANFVGIDTITSTGIFHEYFLNQYTQQEILEDNYFLYIMKQRLFPLFFMFLTGMTKIRKTVAGMIVLWTGFAGGILAVASVLRMGISGMIFYVAAIFPQCIFYLFGYLIALCHMLENDGKRWNIWKTVFLSFSILAGIICEVYLNPEIVSWVLKLFH